MTAFEFLIIECQNLANQPPCRISLGLAETTVSHRPRLLSDNGSSYIADDLADWLADHRIDHVRGAPLHPQTQGKIERWHQTLKNRILLDNYYLPGDLEAHIGSFIAHYNHLRYHESIANLTPADVYFGRGQTILLETRKDQTTDHPEPTLAPSRPGRITSINRCARSSIQSRRQQSQII